MLAPTITVKEARAILRNVPLRFGDQAQIEMLALDVAAAELAAAEPFECTTCDGTGEVMCDCEDCDGHKCCTCRGDGVVPVVRGDIGNYAARVVFETLQALRCAA